VTSVYRKKTFTGLYTKWDSFTPRKYKVNPICTLNYRCFESVPLPHFYISLFKISGSSCCKIVTLKALSHTTDRLIKTSQTPLLRQSRKKDVIITLPYLGQPNIQITKRLKSCVSNFYSFVNLKIMFQNTRRIKSQRSKVIYKGMKAGCWGYNNVYIGKTRRRMKKLNILRPSLNAIIYQLLLIISIPRAITSNGIILKF